MFRSGLAVAASVLWAATANAEQLPPPTISRPPPDVSKSETKSEIKTTKLADGVYMLESQGGNIGGNIIVATAKDGLIMVDGGRTSMHDKIRAAVAAISHQRVKYLIDTQFHADHTGAMSISPRMAPS